MKTVDVTHEELRDLLFLTKGSTFIAARYLGPLNMLKTGNPYVNSTQEYRFTASLNWKYEDAVNRKLLRYANFTTPLFESGPRSWGYHLMDGDRQTCVVTHKGKYYMNCVLGTMGRKTYRFLGHAIHANLLIPFMMNRSSFVKSQGLTYAQSVKKKDFSFDNLKWVQIKGVRYRLNH